MRELNTSTGRLERFCECGNSAQVQRDADTGDVRVVSNHCHDRFCKACGGERAHIITTNLMQHIQTKQVRFVTLTLKHNPERLTLQIDRLLECFRRLRQRDFWKQRVAGCAMFLELKIALDGRLWHPHLHIITEGDFLPKDTLASEWLAVTGDSSIIDVRFVYDRSKAANYVAKYASNPLDHNLYLNKEMLKEAMVALKGRRLCSMMGTWRGVELENTPPDTRTWIHLGYLNTIARKAAQGDESAIAIMDEIGNPAGDPDYGRSPLSEKDTS